MKHLLKTTLASAALALSAGIATAQTAQQLTAALVITFALCALVSLPAVAAARAMTR